MKKPGFQSRVATLIAVLPQTRTIMALAFLSLAVVASLLPALHGYGFDPAHREWELVGAAWAVVLAVGIVVDLWNHRGKPE